MIFLATTMLRYLKNSALVLVYLTRNFVLWIIVKEIENIMFTSGKYMSHRTYSSKKVHFRKWLLFFCRRKSKLAVIGMTIMPSTCTFPTFYYHKFRIINLYFLNCRISVLKQGDDFYSKNAALKYRNRVSPAIIPIFAVIISTVNDSFNNHRWVSIINNKF